MQVNFNATCSSHMPILIEFINNFKPQKVLEFGSGYFSTKIFSERCTNYTAVEITSKIWYNMVSKKYKTAKWNYTFARDHDEALNSLFGYFDLIFIDCSEPRIKVVNPCFYHTKNIVIHDTQLWWTKQIVIPEEFEVFIFKQFPIKYSYKRRDAFAHRPWTTLFTSDKKVIEYFNKVNEKNLYSAYRFPYGASK